ncbi:MAG: chorismate lyase [Gammaproteobacteria bacterium]|nr:chorismate lyase [Gammaproteobacteria bacterium]
MFTFSGSKDPAWRPLRGFTPDQLPRKTRQWLLDEGSLTQRLLQVSGGAFRVQRLHQRWQFPLPSERRLLGLASRQLALVREVALLCEERPWVFARSVIPAPTLTGPLRHLRQLQNQSLGALIFKNPALGRSPFELSLLPGHSPYIDPSLRQEGTAWARRSRFEIQGKYLLVSEVFLDAFRPWSTGA